MPRGRILIVEDDRFYVEFYRDVLEREGFLVDFARSSAEALRRLAADPWDLVIADLVLKGASGLELLTEIKRVDPSRDVIMVTGMQSIRRAVDALRLGASDYLTKPVDRDELLMAINRVLERQVVRQEQTRLISENIHFYDLLRIQKKNLALLDNLDFERLQESVLDTLIGELNSPGATLFLRDPDLNLYRHAAARGLFETGGEDRDLAVRTAALKASLEEGHPLMESKEGDQWLPRAGDEAYRLILPIRHRQETIGAVRLAPRRGERPYGDFDLELARNIVEAAGMALANALALRRTQDRTVQGRHPGTFSVPYFRAFTEMHLAVARRYNREAAILLLTLDNLGHVSRRFQERQANQVVENFCQAILEVIRETDLLTRLEDDLFAVVVPETDFYGALMLKKRIVARLAKAVLPVDLTREIVPVVQVGCAACPRDGNHLQGLMERARKRLDEERRGIWRRVGTEGRDLWGLVARLMRPEVVQGIETADPEQAPQLRAVDLTEAHFEALVRSMLADLGAYCGSRGLLYLGVGTVDPGNHLFAAATPREGFRVSVFAVGAKGGGLWNIPAVTPVFISDPALTGHRFLLAITEEFSYALFCRREGDGTMPGFHTSDDRLVLELVARLQDQYLLQRRIG